MDAGAAESMMRGIPAKHGLKRSLFLAFALTAGLGLAACSDIDSMFGGDESADMAAAAPTAGDAGAPPTASAPMSLPASSGSALVATISPVTIDAGPDTGTGVNKTIQSLRAQVAGLQQKLSANSWLGGGLRLCLRVPWNARATPASLPAMGKWRKWIPI